MLRIIYYTLGKNVLQSDTFPGFAKRLQKYNIGLKEWQEDLDGCLPQALDMLLITDKKPKNGEVQTCPVLGYQPADSEYLPYQYIFEDFESLDYDYLDMVYRRYHKIPLDILETERLKVREITVEDSDRLYEIYSDSSIAEYMEGFSPERETGLEFIQSYIDNMYAFYGYGLWGVCEKETGRLIGRAGISNREFYGRIFHELGYIIAKDCRQKGYATEACRAIIEYARTELAAEVLICLIEPKNLVSKRLALKLGFEYNCAVTVGGKPLELYVIYF